MRLFSLLFSFVFFLTACTSSKGSTSKDSISLEEIKSNGLKLELNDTALAKIVAKRKEAIELDILKKSKADYVNGFLISGNKKIPVSVRLKGDHVDHLEGNRWSFRVKTKKNTFVLGESKFSIQGTHTRSHLLEWIFHQLLKDEGVNNLQYEFIPFQINDIDSLKGIYAFESHFKSEILKRNNKPVGPILKFDETNFWDYTYLNGDPKREEKLMRNSKIRVTNKKGIDKQTIKAAKLALDNYRNNKVEAEKVLDLKMWARYIAVSGLMAQNHNLRWHNLTFYYNPKSKLIEPIGFDCGTWVGNRGTWFLRAKDMELFYQNLYQNQNFKEELFASTLRLSKKKYMEEFYNKYDSQLNEYETLIKQDKSDYKFWQSGFFKVQKDIRTDLEAKKYDN